MDPGSRPGIEKAGKSESLPAFSLFILNEIDSLIFIQNNKESKMLPQDLMQLLAQSIQASGGINIQSLIQWLFMGIISLATTILGIKYGLANLEKKFDALDEEMKDGFKNTTAELKQLRSDISSTQADSKLLSFRIEKIEKKFERTQRK